MTHKDVIRVTKIFNFEMAHALLGYKGDCKNIHGHSYKLHVTLIGNVKHDSGHPNDGMVIDFKDVKRIVKEKIISKYDHAMVVNRNSDEDFKNQLQKNCEKLVVFAEQPTAELLLVHFASEIKSVLPGHVDLFSLKLYETESCYAEWFRIDN